MSAGSWDNISFASDCTNILGAVLCARVPLSTSAVDCILALPRPSLQCISQLGCVLRWDNVEGIRALHPSFRDYLSKRCRHKTWFIDTEEHNHNLAIRCIDFLDKNLHENICGLSVQQLAWDVSLPEALSYASRFWIEHVIMISNASSAMGDQIYKFLEGHLVHWIEALAILKRNDLTMQLLQKFLRWLKVCTLEP